MTPFPTLPRPLNAAFVVPPADREPRGGRESARRKTTRRASVRRRGDIAYSPAAVSVAAYLVLGVTSVTSGAAWIAGQVLDLPPAAAEVASQAGTSAVYVFAGTVITLIVNGIVSDRKSARESAERVALSEQKVAERSAEADRKLIEAKAESDRQLIAAKSEADRKIVEAKAEADLKIAAAEGRIRTLEERLAFPRASVPAALNRRADDAPKT